MKTEKKTVNVLGSDYTIETHKISEDELLEKEHLSGYCADDMKLIVIADLSEKEYFPYLEEAEKDIYYKKVLRHELVHAFLSESGLQDSSSVPSCGWAKHEEMVDWIAIQSPKLIKAFEQAGCL